MQFLADYLLSRAQAALESTDALEKGHAQYVASMAGTWGWGLPLLPACSCSPAPSSSGATGKQQCPGDRGTRAGLGGSFKLEGSIPTTH